MDDGNNNNDNVRFFSMTQINVFNLQVQRIWNFDQSDKTKEDTEFLIDLKQSTEECSLEKIKNTELQSNFSYKMSNIPVGDL